MKRLLLARCLRCFVRALPLAAQDTHAARALCLSPARRSGAGGQGAGADGDAALPQVPEPVDRRFATRRWPATCAARCAQRIARGRGPRGDPRAGWSSAMATTSATRRGSRALTWPLFALPLVLLALAALLLRRRFGGAGQARMSWVLGSACSLLRRSRCRRWCCVLKAPRAGWEAIGAALLLGHRRLWPAGQPEPARRAQGRRSRPLPAIRAAMVAQRAGAGRRRSDRAEQLADHRRRAGAPRPVRRRRRRPARRGRQEPEGCRGLARAGQCAGRPRRWLLTPAALYAYRQAAATPRPINPGRRSSLGLALAQSGRLAKRAAIWAQLLARLAAGRAVARRAREPRATARSAARRTAARRSNRRCAKRSLPGLRACC